MGQYALIFQILGGLLAIFFIFLTVMNTKTWHWLHVTMMFLVFAAACAFAPLAAATLNIRFRWVKEHDQLEKKLADTERQYEQELYGDPGKGTLGLIAARNELHRFVMDRGRIWRRCPVAANGDGTVTVQVVPAAAPADGAVPGAPVEPAPGAPAPGAPAPGAPAPAAAAGGAQHNIKQQEALFAYLEGIDPTSQQALPIWYVGQFTVTAVTDQTVTLRRMVPAGPVELEVVPAGATWSIFETLPVDMHEVFDFPAEQRAAELARLFPKHPQMSQEAYDRMLQGYLRDGAPALDTDPPENIWVQVQFLKPHSIDVDSPTLVSPLNDANYAAGKAQVARLQREENRGKEKAEDFQPVKFAKDDKAFFDYQTATELINGGIARLADGPNVRIYRRTLRDYELAFTTLNRRIGEINTEIAKVNQHIATLEAATAKANEQIRLIETERDNLQSDLTKVAYERDELNKYLAALSARTAELRADLSRLYNSNRLLADELKAISERLTEEIDRRTRQATAASP
jgi:prefoldin subunit 5